MYHVEVLRSKKLRQIVYLLIVNSLVAAAAFTAGWQKGHAPATREVDFVNGAFPNTRYFKSMDPRDLYLDTIKLSLTDLFYEDDPEHRKNMVEHSYWQSPAYTMIGLKGLDNIQQAMENVLSEGVPGDFIEAGAWRGGATIFMRAVLKAYNVTDRTVWVSDSFEGLPVPNPEKYPADKGLDFYKNDVLSVAVPYVKLNFQRYGLFDEQVKFLKGWFKDTLPGSPIEKLAVLRVDGDLYESTMDALTALYDRVSPGGWVIIDDYNNIPACKKAVDDFRTTGNISDPMKQVNWTGVYWVKRGEK